MLSSRQLVLLVFASLLVARVLGIISVYFFEEDEVALATGIAAMVAGTQGDLYRYTVQAGYYRLVEGLTLLAGGRIELIPAIMKGLSALAGASLPILGFYAFRTSLAVRERWLVVFALAVNPIIWQSSRYGNTALVATALSATGLVLLSNRPNTGARVAALLLVGAGILVRADAVLLLPITVALLHETDRNWRTTATWSGAFLLVMGVIYGAIATIDPRADNAAGSVASHMGIGQPSMFWEYLLWAISPAAAVYAVLGARALGESRTRLLVHLALWALPCLLFYFRATTTARYFLMAAVPISVAAGVGMNDLFTRLQPWLRSLIAGSVVIGTASAHLLLALGHVPPDRPAEVFYGGTFQTHDGPMPTGALLVRTYLTSGSLLRALPSPQFGHQRYPFWEGVSFNNAVTALADPAAPDRRIVIILAGGFGHAFHYHAHAAGARFLETPPKGQLYWEGLVRFRLGQSHVTTIASWAEAYRKLSRFEVVAGDQVWSLQADFPDAHALTRVPNGLRLSRIPSFDPRFQTFEVIGR